MSVDPDAQIMIQMELKPLWSSRSILTIGTTGEWQLTQQWVKVLTAAPSASECQKMVSISYNNSMSTVDELQACVKCPHRNCSDHCVPYVIIMMCFTQLLLDLQ